MGRAIAAASTLQLLSSNRTPELIDDANGLAADLLERTLEVLGPEAKARLAGEIGVAADDVHLRVVEQRVFVQVRRPDREPCVVDDADLGVHVQRSREGTRAGRQRGGEETAPVTVGSSQ